MEDSRWKGPLGKSREMYISINFCVAFRRHSKSSVKSKSGTRSSRQSCMHWRSSAADKRTRWKSECRPGFFGVEWGEGMITKKKKKKKQVGPSTSLLLLHKVSGGQSLFEVGLHYEIDPFGYFSNYASRGKI